MQNIQQIKVRDLFPEVAHDVRLEGELHFDGLDPHYAAKIAAHLGLAFIADQSQNLSNTCQANEPEVRSEYRTAVTAGEIFYYLCAILLEADPLPEEIPYPTDPEPFWKLVQHGRYLAVNSGQSKRSSGSDRSVSSKRQ